MTRFSLVLAAVLGTVSVAEARTVGSCHRLSHVLDAEDRVMVTDRVGRVVEGASSTCPRAPSP